MILSISKLQYEAEISGKKLVFNQPLPHLHVHLSHKNSRGPYYVSVKILLWDFSVDGSFFTVHLIFYIQIAHYYGERADTFKPIRTGGSFIICEESQHC